MIGDVCSVAIFPSFCISIIFGWSALTSASTLFSHLFHPSIHSPIHPSNHSFINPQQRSLHYNVNISNQHSQQHLHLGFSFFSKKRQVRNARTYCPNPSPVSLLSTPGSRSHFSSVPFTFVSIELSRVYRLLCSRACRFLVEAMTCRGSVLIVVWV